MSAPGQGGSGQQGGGQGNQNGATTTTTSAHTTSTWSPNATSSTATSRTTTSPSTSTASSSSSSSSGVKSTPIIAGVLGGVFGVLLIALIVICCLQRRKKRELAKKNGRAQPITYTGLNSAFAGVPFRQPNSAGHPNLRSPLNSTYSGANLRGGAASPGERTSGTETDRFLPSYAESQAAMSPQGSDSHTHQSMFHAIPPPSTVSPVSTRAPSDLYNASPEMAVPPLFPPQPARDTMGFPVDQEFTEIVIPPEHPTPIVSPVPRRPLVHQDSLERVVRQGLISNNAPMVTSIVTPAPARMMLADESSRDSTVLGHQNQPRIYQPPPSTRQRWEGEIGRNASQRSVSSVSSMGPSVISDTELERLGVGSRPPRMPVIRQG